MQSLIQGWENHKLWGKKQDVIHVCIYCIPLIIDYDFHKKYDALLGLITSINKKKLTSIQTKTSQMKESN